MSEKLNEELKEVEVAAEEKLEEAKEKLNEVAAEAKEKLDETLQKVKDSEVGHAVLGDDGKFGKEDLERLGQDLKDSNRLEYEADVIYLVYNDVSRNKEAAKIYSRGASEDAPKQPILELDWAKNKISSYKGRKVFN